MDPLSLTVIFITKNEEFHIGDAIENVKDIAERILVVDSGSADKTTQIAEAKGAKVVYHEFENFGKQWNFALGLPVTSEWTMKMDPDERLSDKLKVEISQEIKSAKNDISGFSFDRVLWFMGARLSGVRGRVVRIWRTGKCRFSDVKVNEHPIVVGRVKQLHYVMEHYDSRDLAHWVDKQNKYSTDEAMMRHNREKLSAEPRLFGTSLERRMWVKKFFFWVPCRYLLMNFYLFFFKGAWKSGRAGWRWVKCREMVMRIREYKYIEMQRSFGSR